MANEDAAGYYHARYDAASLAALRAAFATALTVRERVQLATDVDAEVEQGTLPLGAALDPLPAFLADGDLRVFQPRRWAARPFQRARARRHRSMPPLAAWWSSCSARGRAPSAGRRSRAKIQRWPDVRPLLLRMMARLAHDRAVVAAAQKQVERWLRRSHGGAARHGARRCSRSPRWAVTPSCSIACSPRRARSRIGANARCCSARSVGSSRRR